MTTIHPEVLWAQRSSESDPARNVVYLTIVAPDVPKSDFKFDLQPTKLVFTGKSSTKGVTYAVDIDFFGEIDPKESKVNHTGRDIETVLRKKEAKEEFWPRLLKEKAKVHWLKTDFDKWVDEDEQDEKEDDDLAGAGAMGGMGGMGGGMPGMEGFGGAGGGFEGIDFSKFGAGPGGIGGDLPGDSDDEGEDEDDDDMPALEGEETTAAAADTKAHSGIEEIE